MFKGLKSKFVAYSITLVLISTLPITIAVSIVAGRSVYTEHQQNVEQTALNVKNVLDVSYDNLDQNLNMLAAHPLVQSSDASITSYVDKKNIGTMTPSKNGGIEEQIYEQFALFADNHPGTLYVYMGTKDGGYICWPETSSPDNYDPRKREWYKKGMSGEGTIIRTDPYVDSVTGSMLVSNSRIFYDPNGKPYGVMALDMTSDRLSEIVSGIKVGATGYAMMVHKAGLVLVDAKHPDNNNKFLDDINAPEIGRIMNSDRETFNTTIEGTEYLVNSFQFKDSDWVVALLIENSELTAVQKKSNRLIFIITAGILLIVITITILLSEVIKRVVGRIVDGLGAGASEIAAASGELSSASNSMASGATDQASSIEEGSASLEEISSMSRQNSENAYTTDNLMKETSRVISDANQSMRKMTDSMNEILQSSENVSHIIKTIDEIAFQTNLLALNAAVEAARAGNAGAGFSVVAEEVRNLAMRSAKAVDSTTEIIEGMAGKIKTGSTILEGTNQAFHKISESTQKIGHLISEISQTSGEQAENVEQVNTAISLMSNVVQQNAATSEEFASASSEMSAQADSLRQYAQELRIMVNGQL